jgi:hypothetical protein
LPVSYLREALFDLVLVLVAGRLDLLEMLELVELLVLDRAAE